MSSLLWRCLACLTLIALLLGLPGARVAYGATPVAYAVLFYSPSCPHCHYVLDEVLPPLQARYAEQLQVQIIDVTMPEGDALYRAAIEAFAITNDRLGVPTLIIDRTVLVGSQEIPDQLPGLIATTLASGGNRWPAIPGLDLPAVAPDPAPETPASNPFQRDLAANILALILLLVMVVSVISVLFRLRMPLERPLTGWRVWAIPLLAVIGMAIAAYLASVELSGSEAVCGPVGDCNTVQQSAYARLFGVLPIGLLGILAYLAILGAWGLHQFGTGRLAHLAGTALPLLTLVGTLFSIYLTFLEPFVIGATCLWCLSSAALMTALLWLTIPVRQAPAQRGRPRHGHAHS